MRTDWVQKRQNDTIRTQMHYARKGVITLEGKMVERLHLVMARRTVAIADAIGAMHRGAEEWF